ncbi:MAG: ComF family protein [Ruminococcaceae bacterium]|nr:ComF family protein [Oscillospiraceae bacterium]
MTFLSEAKRILDLLFVRKCIFCGKPVRFGTPIALCDKCRPKVGAYGQKTHLHGGLDMAYSLLPYTGMVRQAIRKLKYRNMKYLADTFAELMYRRAEDEGFLTGVDLVTCVPMHPNRARYYNQAEAIAREFSRRTGIEGNFSLLKKGKDIPSFSGMTLTQRRSHVRGAYVFNPGFDVRGKSILLIDDTFTSGTTVNECAKMLKMYGARRVVALTACYAVDAHMIS